MKNTIKLLLALAVLLGFSASITLQAVPSLDNGASSFVNKNDGKDGDDDGNAGRGQKKNKGDDDDDDNDADDRGHNGRKHKGAE